MNTAIGMVATIVNVPHATFAQRVDNDQPDHRQQNDHDQQYRHQCSEAAESADLIPRHLAKRLAVAAHRAEQNDEVLYSASETAPIMIQSVPGK